MGIVSLPNFLGSSQSHRDSAKVRDKLQRDIDAHIAAVRIAKLFELTSSYEKILNEALSASVEALLDGALYLDLRCVPRSKL